MATMKGQRVIMNFFASCRLHSRSNPSNFRKTLRKDLCADSLINSLLTGFSEFHVRKEFPVSRILTSESGHHRCARRVWAKAEVVSLIAWQLRRYHSQSQSESTHKVSEQGLEGHPVCRASIYPNPLCSGLFAPPRRDDDRSRRSDIANSFAASRPPPYPRSCLASMTHA